MTASTAPSDVARRGLARMFDGSQSFEAARRIGNSTLSTIADSYSGSAEGIVASVTQASTAKYLYHQSAVRMQEATLSAIAAGIGGPLGAAIAGAALTGTKQAYNFEDARHLGADHLNAIAKHGDTLSERHVAAAAAGAAAVYLHHDSAYNAQKAALKAIQDGVSNMDATLGQVGIEARNGSQTWEDARNLGHEFLKYIRDHSTDAGNQAFASVANASSGVRLYHQSAVEAQTIAFRDLMQPSTRPLEERLAAFGQDAVAKCHGAEDQRWMGGEILSGIMKHGSNATLQQVARTGIRASSIYLYHRSGAGTILDTLSIIEQGRGKSLDALLARLGQCAVKRGDTDGDSRNMGQVVLEDLAAVTDHEVLRGVLQSATELSKAMTSDKAAIAVQQKAFDWVKSVPDLPRLPGEKEGPSVPVLLARLEFNRDLETSLHGQLGRETHELSQAQAEMTQLANQFNPMVPVENALVRRMNLLNKGKFIGLGGLLGGVLAGALGAPPVVGTALLAAGGITLVGSFLYQNILAVKRNRLLEEYYPLRQQYDQREGEAAAMRVQVDATTRLLEKVQDVIKKDQSALDLIEMVEITRPKTPGEAKAISQEEEQVLIGDLAVPKAPGPDIQFQAPSPEGGSDHPVK